MGAIFLRCFPVEQKPTMVKIPPMVGPFRSPPTARHEQGGEQAAQPHIEGGRRPALAFQIIGAGNSRGLQDPAIGGKYLFSPKDQGSSHHGQEQAAEHKEKEPVVSRGPDEPGFRRYSKGFHHRNHHCGDDTGGKAYIIKRIALMGIVDMGSQRRQHKADGDPHQDA